jgi:hypothetical protein
LNAGQHVGRKEEEQIKAHLPVGRLEQIQPGIKQLPLFIDALKDVGCISM